jgi:hypothetical protein
MQKTWRLFMKSRLFPLFSALVAAVVGTQLATISPAPAKKSSGKDSSSSTASAAKSDKKDLTVKIVSITSPIKAGADATAVAQTDADALCKITVKYKSGPATAAGLKAQHADSTGKVSWTWKTTKNTAAGEWPVEITATSKGAKGSASGTIKIDK